MPPLKSGPPRRVSPKASSYRDIGDVGAVGLEFILALVVGYYGGRYLDGRFFGGHGWMTAFGAVVGVGAAFKAIVDANKRMTKRLEMLDAEERELAAEKQKDRETDAARRRVDDTIDGTGHAPPADDSDPKAPL